MTSEENDSELMASYAQGNTVAFERLYSRNKDALFRYIKSSCNDERDTNEIYQEVWLRVIKGRHTYSVEAPFKAWLFRIARNRLVDFYRSTTRQSPTAPFEEDDLTSVSASISRPLTPEKVADLLQRKDALDEALQRLPSSQREVVLLRHIAGMSVREIAELVGEGTETVKSRLRYASNKLRSWLGELS